MMGIFGLVHFPVLLLLGFGLHLFGVVMGMLAALVMGRWKGYVFAGLA